MNFARLLREWIAILEAEYGLDADASPVTEEGLQELRADLGTSLPAQYEELLRVGDGFFASTAGNLFPDGSTMQLSQLATSRDPTYGIEIWPELDIPYINSGPADWSRLVLIAEGADGRDLAVVAGGAADGAVVVVNFDRFEWVARSLADLVANCLWYYESGFFRFDPEGRPLFEIVQDARQPHPKLAPWTWTCMPYEKNYEGDAPIGAWRWPS